MRIFVNIKKSNMKNLAILFLLSLFTLKNSYAQESPETDLANALSIEVGGTFGKAKIIPKLDKLGIAQITVTFKNISTKSVTKTEKKSTIIGKENVARGTASVSAYLNITDEELTDSDYQEITDHFYNYFQKSLKENNIDTVSWVAISESDFYKNGKDDKGKNDGGDDKTQASVTYNANMGTTMYNGKLVFAFGKAKKAASLSEKVGAPLAFIYTTVEFADLVADIDIKTRSNRNAWSPSYISYAPVTKMKTKTTVGAIMKIPTNSGTSLFCNDKYQAENIITIADIPAEMDYAVELSEDPSLLKKKSKFLSFSTKIESNPVVISTTKDAYKKAAKKALEKYADAFIAKAKQVKK